MAETATQPRAPVCVLCLHRHAVSAAGVAQRFKAQFALSTCLLRVAQACAAHLHAAPTHQRAVFAAPHWRTLRKQLRCPPWDGGAWLCRSRSNWRCTVRRGSACTASHWRVQRTTPPFPRERGAMLCRCRCHWSRTARRRASCDASHWRVQRTTPPPPTGKGGVAVPLSLSLASQRVEALPAFRHTGVRIAPLCSPWDVGALYEPYFENLHRLIRQPPYRQAHVAVFVYATCLLPFPCRQLLKKKIIYVWGGG